MFKLFGRGGAGERTCLKSIAHDLLLWQDDPSFGGALVDRDHQDHHVSRRNQISDKLPLMGGGGELHKNFLELFDACAGSSGEGNERRIGIKGRTSIRCPSCCRARQSVISHVIVLRENR